MTPIQRMVKMPAGHGPDSLNGRRRDPVHDISSCRRHGEDDFEAAAWPCAGADCAGVDGDDGESEADPVASRPLMQASEWFEQAGGLARLDDRAGAGHHESGLTVHCGGHHVQRRRQRCTATPNPRIKSPLIFVTVSTSDAAQSVQWLVRPR
jgi:hypothetical protein